MGGTQPRGTPLRTRQPSARSTRRFESRGDSDLAGCLASGEDDGAAEGLAGGGNRGTAEWTGNGGDGGAAEWLRSGGDRDPAEEPRLKSLYPRRQSPRAMAPAAGSSAEELFDLLEDDYAREILVQTAGEPRSVSALSEACDADPSTIYRRIDRLENRDLVEPEQRLDPDGHHYKVYAARLDRVSITLTPSGFDVEVDRLAKEDPADRFTRLYEEFSG